jgi:threonine synthase
LPASTCRACGGLVDVTYDLERVEIRAGGDSLVRWGDLLPLDVAARFPEITLAPTPTIHARSLGGAIGLPNLFVKNETVLPTGTTKDRMACVALPTMAAHGVRTFAMTSTGNSSTAFAWILPRVPDLEMTVFTPEEFLPRVAYVDGNERIAHFALRGGSYSEAIDAVAAFERANGIVPEGGFFNPSRREGLKLAFLEAVDQTDTSFDWYVQAVSSAMGVYGCYKGAKELHALGRIDRVPRLLCVQEASCAPMVRAFARGADAIAPEDVVRHPEGVASAIMMGDPSRVYPHVARVVRESGGTMIAVDEAHIRDARHAMLEHEGIEPCLSSSAAIAGLLQAARDGLIAKSDRVLLNVSGSGREPTRSRHGLRWLERRADVWIEAR